MEVPNLDERNLDERKKIHPRLLLAVTQAQTEKKLKKALDFLHIPVFYQCRGEGTAPSEIMDILGMGGSTRLITLCFVPQFRVAETFRQLEEHLSIRRKGGGIVITTPLVGMQSHLLSMLNDEAKEQVKKRVEGVEENVKEMSKYTVLWISVAGGYGDDVVEAAREAGARGGTMMKGKRCGTEYAMQCLGISMQDQQDFVMIVVPKEKKTAVMTAISEKCGLRTEAHGVVVALPVEDIMGVE